MIGPTKRIVRKNLIKNLRSFLINWYRYLYLFTFCWTLSFVKQKNPYKKDGCV